MSMLRKLAALLFESGKSSLGREKTEWVWEDGYESLASSSPKDQDREKGEEEKEKNTSQIADRKFLLLSLLQNAGPRFSQVVASLVWDYQDSWMAILGYGYEICYDTTPQSCVWGRKKIGIGSIYLCSVAQSKQSSAFPLCLCVKSKDINSSASPASPNFVSILCPTHKLWVSLRKRSRKKYQILFSNSQGFGVGEHGRKGYEWYGFDQRGPEKRGGRMEWDHLRDHQVVASETHINEFSVSLEGDVFLVQYPLHSGTRQVRRLIYRLGLGGTCESRCDHVEVMHGVSLQSDLAVVLCYYCWSVFGSFKRKWTLIRGNPDGKFSTPTSFWSAIELSVTYKTFRAPKWILFPLLNVSETTLGAACLADPLTKADLDLEIARKQKEFLANSVVAFTVPL